MATVLFSLVAAVGVVVFSLAIGGDNDGDDGNRGGDEDSDDGTEGKDEGEDEVAFALITIKPLLLSAP